MNRATAILASLALLLGGVGQARADLINVDFNRNGGAAGTYSGAAVLGGAGDTWNGVGGNFPDMAARTALSLVNSNGASSGVTLSFSGQTGFYNPASGAVFASSPYAALMDDYVYADGTFGSPSPVSVSFNGLNAGGSYRLILYSASDVPGRGTVFTVNGSSQTVEDPSGSTTLTMGLNYADFTTTADGSGQLPFTFVAGPQAGTLVEGDLDGIQLQAMPATPEPASLTLLGIGIAGIAGYGWRRRKLAAT